MSPTLSPDLQPLLEACFAFTGALEGNILWPYRDNSTAANATLGVGHLLYNAAYAANVFGVTLDILQPQWDALMASEGGRQADFYEGVTDLRITPGKSDELFRSDLWQHILRCRDIVPGFLEIPREVQVACNDIDFNVRGGVKTFPAMLKAIEARDWATVIAESDRPQLPARSKAVRGLLQPLLM